MSDGPARGLTTEARLHFRDQLREASDAEGFDQILFVLERLGAHLLNRQGDLGQYKEEILLLAARSPHTPQSPEDLAVWRAKLEAKYEIIRRARNDALHQGASARHLTTNAVKFSLVLEDALMSEHGRVDDFMVANPLCADLWQQLSLIRHAMLANSFSYLPVRGQSLSELATWPLISDFELARYLHKDSSAVQTRLAERLLDVIDLHRPDQGKVKLVSANTLLRDDKIEKALEVSEGLPVVVLATRDSECQPVGIVTPFDLL